MIVGAATPSSARVVTKVSSLANVRLAVSTSPDLSSPTYFGPVTPDAQGVASVTATGLTADTRHYWQIEHGGVLDSTYSNGRFRTHPPVGSEASYTVALSSCAGSSPDYTGVGSVLAADRLSNHPVYDWIRLLDPLVFFHLGDLHYYDLSSGSHGITGGASLANFRRGYDDVLAQLRQHQLYREVASAYVFDDHCFLGNDKRGLEDPTGAANALTAFRERWPHYPLPNPTDGCYQSIQIGRVLWVLLDVRSKGSANSAVDNSSKTMLGTLQKAWLQSLLAASTAQALVVLGGSQWTETDHDDSWSAFQTERTEVLGIFGTAGGGWLSRMTMGYGDRHATRIITGPQNTNGGFPILMASSLDSTPSAPASGPWQDIPGRGQYGTIRVDDLGGAGITFTLTAYAGTRPTMWHSFSTTGSTVIGAGSPSHVLAL
jgi:phosphodiesterase/alkaline phosphatase D-like protein